MKETLLNGSIPPDVNAIVKAELTADEQLVWIGQPQRFGYTLRSLPHVVLGLALASLVLWQWLAPRYLTEVWSWVFFLVGIYGVTSPYSMWRRSGRTCYVLTNCRAIVLEPGLFGRIGIYSYTSVGGILRYERRNGSGDLIFEEISMGLGGWDRRWRSRGFFAIDQVREVDRLVRETLGPGACLKHS